MFTILVATLALDQGYSVADVTVPTVDGGELQGRIYVPNPLPTSPVPVIGVLPGGGAGLTSVEWGCIGLASSGYVALAVLPQRAGSVSSYATAIQSGITFAGTSANPFRKISDVNRIGGAGWSLGARALTLVQEQDSRFGAIVAWDNLAAVETGDQGSPSGGFDPPQASYRTPKIPALGLASDATSFSMGPDVKKTAFSWWSKHHIPSMEVVFANSNHFWWSGRSNTRQQSLSNYYTVNWFDLWLKKDKTAVEMLLQRKVNGEVLSSLLSSRYRSAASFEGHQIDDLRIY
jgi:dienelactone hydrolase